MTHVKVFLERKNVLFTQNVFIMEICAKFYFEIINNKRNKVQVWKIHTRVYILYRYEHYNLQDSSWNMMGILERILHVLCFTRIDEIKNNWNRYNWKKYRPLKTIKQMI